MSFKENRHGYLMCLIQKDGLRINKTIHRLIALSFLTNPYNKPQVNHKNGIKTDNRVNNLEWVTESENSIHAYKSGLNPKNYGSKNGASKLTKNDVIEIKSLLEKGLTCVSIARNYSVSSSQIERIKNKVNWAWL